MKDNFNKKLLDVVVDTANNLAHHHAAIVESRLTDKMSVVNEDIGSLLDLVDAAEKRQEECGAGIVDLTESINTIQRNNETVNVNFGEAVSKINELKDTLFVVRSDLSNEIDSRSKEKYADDITKLSNSLVGISDELSQLISGNNEQANGNFTKISCQFDDVSNLVSVIRSDLANEIDARSKEQYGDDIVKLSDAFTELSDKLLQQLSANDESINTKFEDEFGVLTDKLSVIRSDLTNEIDDRSKEQYGDDIVKLSESLTALSDDVLQQIATGNETANNNFTKAAAEIDELKERIFTFTVNLNSKASNDRLVEEVSDAVEHIEKLISDSQADVIEDFNKKVGELKDKVISLDHDVIVNKGKRGEQITEIWVGLDELSKDLNEQIETEKEATVTRVEEVISSVIELANNSRKLKANIVGCSDDIAALSGELHKEIAKSEEEDSALNVGLTNVHTLITALEVNNDELFTRIGEVTTDLTDKFNELANESFLSTDKIDLKFSEIQLSLVESDIKRNEIIKESISNQGGDIQRAIEASFDDYKRNLQEGIDHTIDVTLDNVGKALRNDRGLVKSAKPYVRGTEYGENVVVRHLGGMWQARFKTENEPSNDYPDWVCLSAGIDKVTKLKDHQNGVETIIGVHDSLGNVHELSIPVPTIRYRKGVYQDFVDYDHLDSIMKDGCRWVATKDLPEGVPGEEGSDWQVLTMRGPKGMKGAAGERGPRGQKGDSGEQGAQGDVGACGPIGKHNTEYVYTKNMLSPAVTRAELDDIIKEPKDGQTVVIHSDIGIERYFRCEYIGEIDKWVTMLVGAV